MRLASVSALLALYSNPDNKAALSDFTQRFQQRFGELFYDVRGRWGGWGTRVVVWKGLWVSVSYWHALSCLMALA